MKRLAEHDIVRIEGEDAFTFYEVTGTTRTPNGPMLVRGAGGLKQVPRDKLILVTRKGNRYDYDIWGDLK